MKKHSAVTLLSLFIAFMATSLVCSKVDFIQANASADINAAPITVQMRSGGSGANYLVVMDENISATDTPLGVGNFTSYNAPNYINIYTSANSSPISLSTFIANDDWLINRWQSRGVMFPISDTNYETYNGASIYAIEILEGCTYPNARLQKLVVQSTKKYINQNYGDDAHINESFDWVESSDIEPGDAQLLGAQVRSGGSDYNFLVLLDETINPYAGSISVPGRNYNAPDYVNVYLEPNSDAIKLSTIIDTTKNWEVNLWQSAGVMFHISDTNYETYNGATIYAIEVLAGCTYPNNNLQTLTVTQNKKYVNQNYGDIAHRNESFDWVERADYEPSDERIDLFGAEVRADPVGDLYFIDLKSSAYLSNPIIDYPDIDDYINAYDKIIVYLSEEDEGRALGEITSLRNAIQNKWDSQAFMFYLTAEEYEVYNGTTIYRIVVLQDCELMHGNKICKVTRGIDLMNANYGDESARNGAFNFIPYVPPVTEPISVRGAQVRGDAGSDSYYIDFISDIYYGIGEVEFLDLSGINAYDNIKVFLSKDDNGTLLKDVTTLRQGFQDRWTSSAFMFALTREEFEVYNGTTIYALEINAGTEFYVSGAKALVDKTYRFINADYGKPSAKYEAFNFRLEAGDLKDFGNVSMMNIHNRMDKDSGHRWIMFLFEENIYNLNMNVTNWIDQLNFLDNVLIYFAKDSKPILLREIFNPDDEGITLRMFGELNMLGISILNTKENDEYLYSGSKMYMIQINEGTQIPTYEDGDTGYRVVNEKTIIRNDEYGMTGEIPNSIDDSGRPRLYEEWNLNWSVIHCYVTFKVVGIEGLSYPDMSLTPGERVSLDTFKQEGYDLVVTTTDGEKVYQYIIGSNHNIDFILTYTPSSEEQETKKGCGAELITSTFIVPVMAVSLLTILIVLRKEKRYE